MKEKLFRLFDLTVIVLPWLLTGLAAGAWMGEYRLNLQQERYWQTSHQESLIRERISEDAMTILNSSKFVIGDAKAKALSKVKEEIRRGSQ